MSRSGGFLREQTEPTDREKECGREAKGESRRATALASVAMSLRLLLSVLSAFPGLACEPPLPWGTSLRNVWERVILECPVLCSLEAQGLWEPGGRAEHIAQTWEAREGSLEEVTSKLRTKGRGGIQHKRGEGMKVWSSERGSEEIGGFQNPEWERGR